MEKVSFGSNAAKYGLIISVFTIILTFVYYIFDIEIFSYGFMAGNLIIGLLIVIGCFVLGVKNYRNNGLDGKITFGQAFLQGLSIGIIGYAVIAIFNYVFFAYIAPEYGAVQAEGFYTFMESFNLPDEVLEESVREFEKGMTPIGQLKSGLLNGSIMSLIVSLIVAASIKKDTTQSEIS